jgi:hypothetical protein
MERGFATINDGNIKRVALLQSAQQMVMTAAGIDFYPLEQLLDCGGHSYEART